MSMRLGALKAGLALTAACLWIGMGRPANAAPEGGNGVASGYHVIKKVTLGGEGRWDYLTIDSAARRLYISRSSHVMVMDLEPIKWSATSPARKACTA